MTDPAALHDSSSDVYYRLLSSGDVTAISTPVAVEQGGDGTGVLVDPDDIGNEAARFCRIQQISLNGPLDSDTESIDDVYELERASFLDPLNSRDATEDFDHDGLTNFEEYRDGADPEVPNSLAPSITDTATLILNPATISISNAEIDLDVDTVHVIAPAASIAGDFAEITGTDLGDGLGLAVEMDETTVSLRVVQN